MLQDWCDKDKFIRQRWTTICTERGLAAEKPGDSKLENLPGNSLSSVLSAVFDEFVHGQDRYISRIWYKYHPETNQDPQKMFKFSFPEFVRFLVNGTEEFADDDYVLRHRGVSYHWENYWAECPVCDNLTRSVYYHLIRLGNHRNTITQIRHTRNTHFVVLCHVMLSPSLSHMDPT